MSSGGIPILGHATLFKKNPPSFLKSVQDKDGPVFRINLAGRDMVIIGDDEKARKQVQFAAPSVLSSTQAVADVGFDYALSQRSIDFGTLFHKHVLKHYFYRGDGSKLFEEAIRDATERAFEQETSPGAPCVVTRRDTAGNGAEGTSVVVNDLIQFSRRMTTRVSIAVFCGSGVSVDHDLVSECMAFEEQLEATIAKSAVLPRYLSVPLLLRPLQKRRHQLEANLLERFESAWKQYGDDNAMTANGTKDEGSDSFFSSKIGPWLHAAMINKEHRKDVSNFAIGLLFTAAKNPSIGGAQSFLFLKTMTNSDVVTRATEESGSKPKPLSSEIVLKCVLETVRLTGNTIGSLRTAMKAFTLQLSDGTEYDIPKGQVIAVSHSLPNKSTAVWGTDAEDFNYERQGIETATTFGGGLHKCPAQNVAITMMESMVCLWLRQGMVLNQKTLPDLCYERATLTQRKGAVAVTVNTLLG